MQLPANPDCPQRYVQIDFGPGSGCLGSIVSVVSEFCNNVVDDLDTRFAFQLAAYELTENLVKYSNGEVSTLRIQVECSDNGHDIVLTTENEASAERLADAATRLEAIESAEDPTTYFYQLVSEDVEDPSGSRLGFGRLRAETNLHVSHELTDRGITIRVRRSTHPEREEVRQ